jgi:hypothetical protein
LLWLTVVRMSVLTQGRVKPR